MFNFYYASMKLKQISLFLLFVSFYTICTAQISPEVKNLINSPRMKGASFSLVVQDLTSGKYICSYDADRLLTPASVLKVVTTATALELLGEDYRYPTTLEYDGTVGKDGTLEGNLYIRGSGDPTLGSSHMEEDKNGFLRKWIKAVREAGIKKINGKVIADESIFDTEGASPKWVYEDLGSYYGAGSYGLSVFDNLYRLYVKTAAAGSIPSIVRTEPKVDLEFHNYMRSSSRSGDSTYIIGAPFSNQRFLYGEVAASRSEYELKGDIPDPPLFLAGCLRDELEHNGIKTGGGISSYRLESEAGRWTNGERKEIIITYSVPLLEIVRICNYKSHNLYADALLKTIGLRYKTSSGENISSFARGVRVVNDFWKGRGADVSGLQIVDGSGLASADKCSASFLSTMLMIVGKDGHLFQRLWASLPEAGVEGSVRSLFKDTKLQGKARMKSGGMSGVRTFIGYVTEGDKRYSVVIMANNYNCSMREMTKSFEKLLLEIL